MEEKKIVKLENDQLQKKDTKKELIDNTNHKINLETKNRINNLPPEVREKLLKRLAAENLENKLLRRFDELTKEEQEKMLKEPIFKKKLESLRDELKNKNT